MSRGNLQIFDEEQQEVGFLGAEHTEKFEKIEAKIIWHFFREELKEIGQKSIIIRKPKNGPEVDTLLVIFGDQHALSVRSDIDKLKRKVRELPKKEFELAKDKIYCISNKNTAFGEDTDTLILLDLGSSRMVIVGTRQDIVCQTAHRFQVSAGIVLPTSRQNHPDVDNSSEEYESIQQVSSNIDKCKKPAVTNVSSQSLSSSSRSGSAYTSSGQDSHSKMNAGLVNPTMRENRTVVDYSSDESKSIRASNSSLTNMNKYNKPNITGGFSSAPRSGSDYTSGGCGSSDPKAEGTKTSSKRSYNRQSSSEKINFEIALKNGFVFKVYNESITKLDVDVIVNAANDTMMHGGGVARVISEAAGWRLDNESREYVDRHGPLSVTENIVTTAGDLRQYKAVIHAVGPEWHKYKDKVRCLDDLFDCIYDILATCKEKRFRTVGMPSISTGRFGVPKELCANMYVYAAAKFSATLDASECPGELHVVDIDTIILKLVEESSKRWENNPESLNPRVCVPDFLERNPTYA